MKLKQTGIVATGSFALALALGACGSRQIEERDTSGSGPASIAGLIAKGDLRIADALKANRLVRESEGFVSRSSVTARELSASVARTASGPTLLAASGGSLRVVLRGASESVGELEDGVVVYKDAYAGVDRVVTSTASVHEELLLVRQRAKQLSFEWDVELGAGLHAATADGRGGLSFVDDSGSTVLHVPEPYAIDAKGMKSVATLAWNAATHRIGVTLPNAEQLAYPVLLDPAFESYVWQKMGAPPAADTAVMAFDTARGRSVLVSRGVTWTSNGFGWMRASETGPSGRDLTAIAYDPSRSRVVLFGGLDGVASGATWEWDGVGWSQQFPTTAPSARYGHALAYDSVRGTVVLFGGTTGSGDKLADMWEWNGKTWTKLTPATLPSGRAGHSMALDSDRKKVVLFGGGQLTSKSVTTATAETWEWDGVTWTQKAPALSPSARGLAAASYDTVRKRVALFAGEAAGGAKSDEYWEWDGTAWTKTAAAATRPSTRSGEAFAFDTVRNTGVVFGGLGADNRTWRGNGIAWTAASGGDVGQRHSPSMVFDSVRGKALLLGGSAPSYANTFFEDIWEWDGSSWTKSAVAMPKGDACNQALSFNGFDSKWYCWGPLFSNGWFTSGKRFGAATAFDAKRGVTVMFGGTLYNDTWFSYPFVQFTLAGFTDTPDGPGGSALAQAMNDTWTFNGTAWTLKTVYQTTAAPSSTAPAARREAAMVYVPTIEKTILFGGGGLKTTAYNDTWSWDGSAWTLINPTGGVKPPARGSHAMAFDANRGKIVMFGGSLSTGFSDQRSDTWEFDPATNTWTSRNPTHVPPNDAFPSAAYDPIRKAVVLFTADAAATTGSLRTWVWDGTDWTDNTSASSPPLRRGAKVVYDSTRKQFVMAGGADAIGGGGAAGDTWTLYSRGQACVANSECSTGFCTDGVCCEVPSCGTCEACNGSDSVGTCTKVRGASDSDSCTGTKTCDLTGACKSLAGQACAAASDCATGFCVDGVCCDTECKGFCQSCNGAQNVGGVSGVCGDTKAGVDPRNDCAAEDVSTCGRTGFCDGKGACEKVANGVSCATATKVSACSGNRAVGWVCNGLGTCGNTVEGTDCTPFVCNLATGGCTETCSRDVDCVDSAKCDSSTKKCVIKASYCKDDHTVVDVNGTESDCGLFKCSAGQCLTVTVCQADGHTLLQADGTLKDCAPFECSGDRCVEVTACKSDGRTLQKADGTTQDCAPFLCIGNRCANVNACQADGHTLLKEDGTTVDCAPFACAGTACVEKCGSLAQCASPNVCGADGTCVAPSADNAGDGGDGGGCGCVTAPTGNGRTALMSLIVVGALALASHRRRKRITA